MRTRVAVLALVALAACGGEGAPSGTGLSMRDHSFTPKSYEVEAGDTVEWVNDSDEAHTVTAMEESLPAGAPYFSSGDASSEEEANGDLGDELIDPGETFEWTFGQSGTYRYYCIPHKGDGMEGVVIVR